MKPSTLSAGRLLYMCQKHKIHKLEAISPKMLSCHRQAMPLNTLLSSWKSQFVAFVSCCCSWWWGFIYLWDLLLWLLKAFLEEKVWSHMSHEMHIPSRWLASMWYFIKVASPSLPHTLQMRDTSCLGVPSNCLPDGIIFWPFSIIDLTFSSSAWRSALIFHSQLLLLLISCLAHLLRVLD